LAADSILFIQSCNYKPAQTNKGLID